MHQHLLMLILQRLYSVTIIGDTIGVANTARIQSFDGNGVVRNYDLHYGEYIVFNISGYPYN